MKDEPAKGKGAMMIFFSENRAKVSIDHPELKGLGPVQTKLSSMWKEASEEERQTYKDKEKEQNALYQQQMAEFQQTEDYKKYKRLSGLLMRPAGKGKAKAKAMPSVQMPDAPDNLPKPAQN